MGKAAPPNSWEVVLIDDRHVNAYINRVGQITVTSGMASLFGAERGLWAVVLGHEIGHFVVHRQLQAYLPGFQAQLDKAYRATRAAEQQPGAAPPVRLVPLAGGRGKKALAREYEADRVGLMMMAQAGYHPDFAIALNRLLLSFLGNQPKLVAFLSGHPSWSDRERRMQQDHNVALAIFQSAWPDPAKSPGGPAPALGTIGTVTVDVAETGPPSLILHVPVEVRNAGSRKVRVEAAFLDNDRMVQSTVPEYRGTDGSLVLNVNLEHPTREAAEVVLRVPLADLASRNRKLKAEVFLIAGDQILDLAFKPFEMRATGE